VKSLNTLALRNIFLKQFDLVGIIRTEDYLMEAKKRRKDVFDHPYPTLVVLGLRYPKRFINSTETDFVSSFYTFGKDYHLVMQARIKDVMASLDVAYEANVDSHPYDERLAAVMTGLGFFAKNQLIINETFGSYLFLGMVFIDIELKEPYLLEVNDDCGTCTRCIEACPTGALFEGGYDKSKCISFYNQEKQPVTEEQMLKNYQLFGCDICQIVCPKNIKKGNFVHDEFQLSGKEMVSVVDLFTLTNKTFTNKYRDMAYLWKGKTLLMRNGLMLMYRQKNTRYLSLIEESLTSNKPEWYVHTAEKVLRYLKQFE